MQRAMAVEAEASREARAKVIRVLTKSIAIYTWLLSVFTNISARFNEKCCRGRDRVVVVFTTTLPLSTLSQVYGDGLFNWWRKSDHPEKTITLSQATENFIT
jgi:hypothetical protein